jgi:hypothetical protein
MPHGMGRVVRWDVRAGTGAVVVRGLQAEVLIDEDAVETADERDLRPGELVEIEYERAADGPGYVALRVCPTDAEG